MASFRKLAVWEKAHALTLLTYRLAEERLVRRYPELASQLTRAVASIPANLAEGLAHGSDAQLNRFLSIAYASAQEADYHLLLAKDLGAIPVIDYAHLEARLTEVRQMLSGLRRRVQARVRDKGKRGGRTASPLTPAT
jgi:four helix bundle protein